MKTEKLTDLYNHRHSWRQNQHKFNSVSYYHSSETLKEEGYSSLPRRIKEQYGSLMRSYSALTRSSSMQSVHKFLTRFNFSNTIDMQKDFQNSLQKRPVKSVSFQNLHKFNHVSYSYLSLSRTTQHNIEFDPFDEIGDLNISEGELNIHPAIPASELIWSSPSDIQHVFSIELLPYTLGWPRRTLYFLAPTFSDKQKWVKNLELISEEVKKSTQSQRHGMADEVILTLEKTPLVLNCAALLNETGAILGCEDGLYVVSFKAGTHQNKPVHIVGIGAVYQLQIVRDLAIAVLIAGKERELCYIDIFDLESRLKQLQTGAGISAITSHQIEKVKGCHIFIIEQIDNVYHACAATSRKMNILKFQSNNMNFSLKKEVETTEPATCLLFTQHSAIFGTSKFYTVDLKNFQKRDLLDASDTSLAFAVFGTSQTQSFPIAVFNIGEGKSRDEYLLCYNQFGIFVDWQGRRSRKGDLKWSRLPLAFEYRAPHLYISHFSSIEICEIPGDIKSDISTIPRRFVDVPDPRFVGVGLQSRIVLFSSSQKQKVELISYQASITIPLSRNASTASAMSLASHTSSSSGFDSIPSTILETSILRSDTDIHRASSNASMCSDEETSHAIAKDGNTPRNKRKDQVRHQDKDKNRISFRFFKQNRKSQNLDS